ncbi:MAG: 4a-hydroxytetrahydrobiopterin dehydratase [Miltoncostaeaceae bacterium]|jgi:4a-hydroxytetrahydrobiopterin dehydratase|nr:4a-hydroxytetrahydrobiopterin dehydratase [Miltoncostaeaceae bacterium]
MAVLSEEQVAEQLKALPDWRMKGGAIVREFTFDGGFMGSIGFVNRLAAAAEVADHHPDLEISWNKVTVTFSTHSQGGVTDRDLEMAAEADRLAS